MVIESDKGQKFEISVDQNVTNECFFHCLNKPLVIIGNCNLNFTLKTNGLFKKEYKIINCILFNISFTTIFSN